MATKDITYDPAVFPELGNYQVTEGPAYKDRDKNTLVRLMFVYTYVKEARDFLNDTAPSKGVPVDKVKALLTEEFSKFGVPKDSNVMRALIDAHLHGDAYAALFKTPHRTPEQDAQMLQAAEDYEINLQVIMDAVHDEAMGQVFSMAW